MVKKKRKKRKSKEKEEEGTEEVGEKGSHLVDGKNSKFTLERRRFSDLGVAATLVKVGSQRRTAALATRSYSHVSARRHNIRRRYVADPEEVRKSIKISGPLNESDPQEQKLLQEIAFRREEDEMSTDPQQQQQQQLQAQRNLGGWSARCFLLTLVACAVLFSNAVTFGIMYASSTTAFGQLRSDSADSLAILSNQSESSVRDLAHQVRRELREKVARVIDALVAVPPATTLQLSLFRLMQTATRFVTLDNPEVSYVGAALASSGRYVAYYRSSSDPDTAQFQRWLRDQGPNATVHVVDDMESGRLGAQRDNLPYDPRTRSWYRSSVAAAGQPVWSAVYIWVGDPAELGIAFTRPLFIAAPAPAPLPSEEEEEELTVGGVLSVDFALSRINTFLAAQRVGRTGVVYLVDRSDGLLVATSRGPIAKPSADGSAGNHERIGPAESTDALIASSFQAAGGVDAAGASGEKTVFSAGVVVHCTALSDPWGLNWLMVMAVPEADYLADIQLRLADAGEALQTIEADAAAASATQSAATLAAVAISLGLAVAVAAWATEAFTSPLNYLASHLRKLERLDFSKDDVMTMDGGGGSGSSAEAPATRGGGVSWLGKGWIDHYYVGRIEEIRRCLVSYVHMRAGLAAFARFVPSGVVRRIVAGNERAAQLYVEMRRVTVLFTDIEGFTSISERLEPRELVRMLDIYMTCMCDVVEEFRGEVGDLMGDGLHAFWNASDRVRRHERLACMAALRQQKLLRVLNRQFEQHGWPALRMRAGLHTGEVHAGNIGSPNRMKFGVLGDSVNLAARLESLGKMYSCAVLISKATKDATTRAPPSSSSSSSSSSAAAAAAASAAAAAAAATTTASASAAATAAATAAAPAATETDDDQSEFVTRLLDYAAVKGKSKGVWIYELVGLRTEVDPQRRRAAAAYSRAVSEYFKKNLKASQQALEEYLSLIADCGCEDLGDHKDHGKRPDRALLMLQERQAAARRDGQWVDMTNWEVK